ncbi:hypothetical protein [Brevundimonas fluminis]|jgi:hypothetical protein|uniref:hypothetical protein n=1 Tax=Brevundimonas fluminis TaxID=2487274 RepID=UPI000F656312|nr:hypothetical protein [Brevundimonas fluminis]
MKVIGILGAAALLGVAGCASTEMRAESSSHCEANISTRVLASDCEATTTRTARPIGKVQQRNGAVTAELARGA